MGQNRENRQTVTNGAERDRAEKRRIYLWRAGYSERYVAATVARIVPFSDRAERVWQDDAAQSVLSGVDADDGNGADF